MAIPEGLASPATGAPGAGKEHLLSLNNTMGYFYCRKCSSKVHDSLLGETIIIILIILFHWLIGFPDGKVLKRRLLLTFSPIL